MKKLSSQQIKHLAYHNEAIDKAYKSQIYFCFDSKDAGKKAYDFLKEVYADECNYDAWSGWFGLGDKRDFYLGFVSPEARDLVYQDLMNAIGAYQTTNQYQNDFLANDELKDDQDNKDITQNTNWVIYLIIGAAAVAIILLLWDRKKK